MKRFFSIILLLFFLPVQLVSANNLQGELSQEDVDEINQQTVDILADELVFENIASLAGSSCSLYALGVDLVNLAYDGQWSFLESLLEVSVLFRNQPWRELIWAINDQREAYVTELTSLQKQRCVLAFAKPEAQIKNVENQRLQEVERIDQKIIELQEKIDVYAVYRRNMLFDRPVFYKPEIDGDSFVFDTVPVDKIFYPVGGVTALDVNWDQFLLDSKRVVTRVREDLQSVVATIPEDCFAVVRVGTELDAYFVAKFRYQDGAYVNEDGDRYETFRDFVNEGGKEVVDAYIQETCESSRDRALAQAEETSAEQQYEQFLRAVNQIITTSQTLLSQLNQALSQLPATQLTEAQQVQKRDLLTLRARMLATIDYYSLVIQKVPSPESQSLDRLAESLADLSEAILGVVSDEDGRQKSRLSFAERFEKANIRNMEQICGRIEAMYRQVGRDTSDLPLIGYADGKRYCRATTDCADVNLGNLVGGSEGRRKLAECSGFLFEDSEQGPSQFTQDVISTTSQDLSLLLQERALNDLLKQRNLHFASLRNRYDALYGSQTDTTVLLEQIIEDVTVDLYNPEFSEVYNPEGNQPKTHFSLLRKIYQDFWKFMDQQEGYCPAPEEPSF